MIARLLLLFALLLPASLAAQSLPDIRAADLNKKKIHWPADLAAERTLLLVAFERKQQKDIDTWVNGMKLKAPGAPAWYEVPMIKNPGGLVRSFIDGGMRRGIPAPADRARVVTVYGDKKAMLKQMAISDESMVHALVVARDGRIIIHVPGRFSEAGAQQLEAALSAR